jgi:hypothetical protein
MTNPTPTRTNAATHDTKRIEDSTWLKLGGAGFLSLSGGFLWRDLSLPAAALMLVAAGLATLATLFRLPRRWPLVAPAVGNHVQPHDQAVLLRRLAPTIKVIRSVLYTFPSADRPERYTRPDLGPRDPSFPSTWALWEETRPAPTYSVTGRGPSLERRRASQDIFARLPVARSSSMKSAS